MTVATFRAAITAPIDGNNVASEFQNYSKGLYEAIGFVSGQLVHTDGKRIRKISVLDSLKWEIKNDIEWGKDDRLDVGANIASRVKWLKLVQAQLRA